MVVRDEAGKGSSRWVVVYRCFKESGYSPKGIWIVLHGREEQNGSEKQMMSSDLQFRIISLRSRILTLGSLLLLTHSVLLSW